MVDGYQSSLFDTPDVDTSDVDTSDAATDELPTIGALAQGLTAIRRTELAHGAWVDHLPNWLPNSAVLLQSLQADVPWHAERRRMFDTVVEVPRLTKFYGDGETMPHPLLVALREVLSQHYRDELGEDFVSAGLCLYRDGRDSVAWHGDRIGRSATENTMVAIVSVGSARTLRLRPRGGGTSIGFSLGHGDLAVMGGSCQRTWDHCVPKTSRPVGPRVSIQFRPLNVR